MSKSFELKIEESRARDAVMLYGTQILKLYGWELAYLAKLVYSPAFLLLLKRLRLEMKIDDFTFFNLEALHGISPAPGEDQEELGYKLIEWVDEELEEYRNPLKD